MKIINNKEEFNEVVANGYTLVDFFATWCGPCKMLTPVLEQVSADYEGTVNFVKVDVDQNGELAQQFGVMSIPNLFLLKDGKQVASTLGYMSADDLKKFINGALN